MLLRKSKTSRKSLERSTFLSLDFYNAPSPHTEEFEGQYMKEGLTKGWRTKGTGTRRFFPCQSHASPVGPLLIKLCLMRIQEGFAVEPPRNDSGANFHLNDSGFGPKVRVTGQKVGVTGQKSELQPGRPPESEPNRPEKGPEWRLGASTENPP